MPRLGYAPVGYSRLQEVGVPSTDPDVVFVDEATTVSQAVDAMRAEPVVGFDTEFVGESTYESLLCLVQIATSDRTYVIDPLVGLDLTEFWQVLTDPSREVIALAARQELLFCLKFAGRLPGRLFDPQVAAGLVGLGYPLSHTNLVQRVLKVRVRGGETYTDWRKRPLTPSQLHYAAEDVRHLIAVRAALLSRARELSREEWIEAECAGLAERVARGAEEERWFRVSGASRLNRRELAALREVWQWRDATARRVDSPPRRVLTDDMMIQIVKRSPATVNDLLQLRGTDRLRRDAEAIVAAVGRAKALPEDALPELLSRDDPVQVQVLGQLASIVSNSLAAQHHVDTALLATTADLQEVVRWRLGLTKERPGVLDGWRGAILGDSLLALLDGRSAIRVGDLRSRSPLRIEPVG
jgi:ribonuclease D